MYSALAFPRDNGRTILSSEEVEHNDFLADVFGELKALTACSFELEIRRNSPCQSVLFAIC